MLLPPDDLSDDQIEVWQQAAEYFHRAYQQQASGDLAGAMQDYQRSLMLFPTAEAHTFLGWVYAQVHLYAEAIAECQKAIAVDPSLGNPYNDIGAYLVEMGRANEAIHWFDQAITAPRYAARANPHYNLGRIYEEKGKWLQAMRHYRRALREKPAYADARKALRRLEARLN
jgi:Tfp pilus assembly protein PilF